MVDSRTFLKQLFPSVAPHQPRELRFSRFPEHLLDPAHHAGAYGTMRLVELVETRVRVSSTESSYKKKS